MLELIMADIEKLKQLRQETCVSLSECKKALEESKDDIDKAKEILRKWGKTLAGKKTERITNQGIVETYVHPNKRIGVMIELRCESDFVARSEEFQKLAHELCLQIAAANPLFIKEEDIPEHFLDGEKEIYLEQIKDSGKPQKIIDQIIEGKLNKYLDEICLLRQAWIKNDTRTIQDLTDENISRIGENIVVKKFARYDI